MPPRAASRLAPLLAALACAAPAREARRAEGPAAPGAGPAAVALAFAWPEGFQARVALEHRQQRGGDAPTGARLVYRLVSEPVRGAIRVSTRETRAEGDAPDLEVNVRISEALRQVVGRDGSYLRTEGLEEALAALEADDEEERAASREALERIAALDWELLVGAWAGRSLQPARPVARELAGSFPLLPGVPAVLDVELALVGPAACEEGDPEPACVELAWRGVPGPAARQAALDRLRSRATGGSAVLEGLEGRTEARLVAEPGTLVPHRLAIEEELTLRVRPPGGDLREIAERTQDRYQFTREVEY